MSLILFSVILVGQTASDCDVAAFVLDAESGVNIRAGAGKDFKILKTVPKDKNRTMFEI